MIIDKEKKLTEKEEIEEDKHNEETNLFGFRGYTTDIFSTLQNSGME